MIDLNKLYTYDIETYRNVFTCVTKRFVTGEIYIHEWSERKNQLEEFINFLHYLKACDATMVGFNNVGFDYPVLHYLADNFSYCTLTDMFNKVQSVINVPRDQRFAHIIWDRDRIVKQMDLYLINHFDNIARATSLKMLEFNRRSGSIQDLPYPPGSTLTLDQLDPLIKYNIKDVNETEGFLIDCMPAIELRADLSKKFGKDFTNHNDVKIGRDYFIMELEKNQPGICYYKDENNRKKPHQTIHTSIALGDVILPYIKFEHPEFQRIHSWFQDRVITETKGSIKDLSCVIDGVNFVFGTGGLHGSVESSVFTSDEDDVIMDIDVEGYYPSNAMSHGFHPEHLDRDIFCRVNNDLKQTRKKYPKGTSENKVFKLSMNGPYGDSGSKYSPFYDTKYMMEITINGQLLLCMLAEQLLKIPDFILIQVNTDGLTFKVSRQYVEHVRTVCRWWEKLTNLVLEEAFYSRMWIANVNNYIAETEGGSGKLKLKGKYAYELGWHQNHSSLVVQKAAKAFLVDGVEPADFLRDHDDVMDFFLRTKVPRSSRLILGTDGNRDIPNPDPNWMTVKKNIGKDLSFVHSKQHFTTETPLQNITRYYISNTGGSLIKIMPPLPKQLVLNPDAPERRFKINAGWLVTPCNDIRGMSDFDINYKWYLDEVEKLISYAR